MTSHRWTARLVALVVLVATLTLGLGTTTSATAGEKPARGKPSAAALAAPGELAVTVTAPGGAPVYGEMDVYQWQSDGEYFDFYDYRDIDTPTTPYEEVLEVPAGDYYVAFYDYTDTYGPGLSEGATEPPSTPADLGSVRVSPDAGADTTVALTPLPGRVAVTGSVEDTAGAPLEDIYVYADGPTYDEAYTDADGDYRLDLRAGTYELYFEDTSGDHGDASTTVEVADVPVVVDTVQLASRGRRAVSGRVLGSDGAGLADADVTLFELIDYDDDGVYDDWSDTDDAVTDAAGNYVLSRAYDGSTYTVGARGPGHAFAVLGGGRVVENGTPVPVDGADVTAPDLQLAAASTLSGVVSGPDGPASDVNVTLYRWYEEDETFYYEDDDYSAESGRYGFGSLEPGFYTLHFDPAYSEQALAPAWLEGTSEPTSTTDPGVFEVTATPTAVIKNKTLARAQTATGRLTDAEGNGLSGGSVVTYVYEDDGEGGGYWDQWSQTTTGDDGAFHARVPASSTVTFRFARGGFTPQFLGGGSSLPGVPDSTNSRQTGPTEDLTLGPIALAPFQSRLGKVAGQDLAYCRDSVLPANDDGSSDDVEIPFDLRFFGDAYDTLYVNNNGNVTFGDSLEPVHAHRPHGGHRPPDHRAVLRRRGHLRRGIQRGHLRLVARRPHVLRQLGRRRATTAATTTS